MLINFVYNNKELKIVKNEELKDYLDKKDTYLWICASNVSDEELAILKEMFNIHPTTVEDIFSTQTRVKYEEFEEYTLIIFKAIKSVTDNSIETHNMSFILGENFLITVNGENETIDNLSKNQKRVENLLKKGEDYILHNILDKEVDKYLRIKTKAGEDLKKIEREFMENQNRKTLQKIFSKELTFLELRQLSESITDLFIDLTKPADNYIHNDLIPYFRDIYDHTFKTTEGYKSMLGRMNGMKNMYSSIITMRTNETIRSLTIIMALMMPLTIITGFYGMNVKLPLQDSPFASEFILLMMIFFSAMMIIFLRRRGWTSGRY